MEREEGKQHVSQQLDGGWQEGECISDQRAWVQSSCVEAAGTGRPRKEVGTAGSQRRVRREMMPDPWDLRGQYTRSAGTMSELGSSWRVLSRRVIWGDPGFPEEGMATPLQYSCLENPMDRGVWWAILCGVAKSQTEHTCRFLKHHCGDFPGGPVVKNLPCNTGDMGSILGQRIKILHATEQLSPCALEPTDPKCHN